MVDTISYTGWKLVCVMPYSIFTNKMADVKQFVFVIMIIMAMMFVWINRVISIHISKPIMKLDDSVKRYENGNEADIYVGGSSEIRHLGYSIRNSYKQNNELMKKVVWEQNERRKSELDVLQSQINPHFLYNTLYHMDDRGGQKRRSLVYDYAACKAFPYQSVEGTYHNNCTR